MSVPSRYYTEPPYKVTKTVTFADAVGQGRVGSDVPVFSITGRVLLHHITAYCTTLLTKNGSATMALGTASVPAGLIAATDPEVIDADEWWAGTTPVAGIAAAVPTSPVPVSEDIVVHPATDDISAGVIVFTAWYDLITADGQLA